MVVQCKWHRMNNVQLLAVVILTRQSGIFFRSSAVGKIVTSRAPVEISDADDSAHGMLTHLDTGLNMSQLIPGKKNMKM